MSSPLVRNLLRELRNWRPRTSTKNVRNVNMNIAGIVCFHCLATHS
jgi:hypothetical protein